jgi:putative SOS response-associated peptidase YedK
MCSRYTYTKDEAKLRLRDRILVFGAVPRANIRPTDLGPVIIPEHEGFACREMRWGCLRRRCVLATVRGRGD